MNPYTKAEQALAQGDPQSALSLYLLAVEDPETLASAPGGLSEIYRKAARSAFLLQDHPRAIEFARKALIAAKEGNNTLEQGEANITLGVLYGNMNAWELSIDHSRKGYELVQTEAPIRAAAALNNIGNVYEAMGHIPQAIEYFESSAALYQDLDTTDRNFGIILGNLGKLKAEQGLTEEGLELLNNGVHIFENLGDLQYQAHTLAKIARVWEQQGLIHQAEVLYRDALDLLDRSPHPLWKAEILIQLGIGLIDHGKFHEAGPVLEQALNLIDPEKPSRNLSNYYQAMGRYHESKQDYRQALEHHRKYAQWVLELQKQQGSNNLAKALALLDTERLKLEKELFRIKNEELQNQVIRDPLTGLYNRRYLMDQLPTELARIQRSGDAMGFGFVDVNAFKEINDVHSHLVGDKVLVQLAKIFQKTLRQSDTTIRYGGDEFILFMPGVGQSSLEEMQKKLEQAVQSYPWHELSPNLEVSVSVGIILSEDRVDLDEILHIADSRMYQRKTRQD